MAKDPFYYELDEKYRGTRIRVHTTDYTYEGWCRMFHYDQHAVLLYDVVRNDGEEVGPVTVSEPETIERIETGGPISEISVNAIHRSPYDAREYNDPGHKEFVKQTRERGHLLTFPAVRPLSDDEYETVGGHRRMEAARRAGLDELPVRVLELDDWAAVRRFVDEHIPIEGGNERNIYGQEEIDYALDQFREECPSSRSAHAVRRSYITHELSGVDRSSVSERCDVSEEVIREHYDTRDESKKMSDRQQAFEQARRQNGTYRQR